MMNSPPSRDFPLPKGLFMVSGDQAMWPASANIYLIRDDRGLSMIDVGCGGAKCCKLLAKLEEQNLALQDVHTVILSHAHPDHMGAMSTILEQIKPEIIIHHIDAPLAENPALLSATFDIPLIKERLAGSSGDTFAFIENFDLLNYFEEVGCAMCSAIPTATVHGGEELWLGDFCFEVVHTPGHAPGHISLYEKNKKFLIAGDLIGSVLAWYSPSSGGVIGYLASLEKIEKRELTLILPSHGEPILNVSQAIKSTREKLLRREGAILKELSKGTRTFSQLLDLLFGNKATSFFLGAAILESHLLKLEKEGRVVRGGNTIKRV